MLNVRSFALNTGICAAIILGCLLSQAVISSKVYSNAIYIAPNLFLEGSTPNTKAVVAQLGAIENPSSAELNVLTELALLDPCAQLQSLNQMSAEPYTSLLITNELAAHQFIKRLYNPIRPLMRTNSCKTSPCGSQGVLWLEGGYSRSNLQSHHCISGFHLDGWEGSFGIQGTYEQAWTVGLAGSYQTDNIHYGLESRGEGYTYLGALYTFYRTADSYFIADLVLGYNKHRVKRSIDIGPYKFHAHGKPEAYEGVVYLEAGSDLEWCGCYNTYLLQPFIGFEAGSFRINRIHEHSSAPQFDVTVSKRIRGSANSRMGVHFYTKLPYLRVAIDAAWQYRWSTLNNSHREHFKQFGEAFNVKGLYLKRNSFDGGLYLSTVFSERCELYTEATGQWWDRAFSYSLQGGLLLSW